MFKMNYDLILIRYGEISLKSDYVRNKFEKILIDNIRKAFKLNNLECIISRERGRIYLVTKNLDKEVEILSKMFGIVSFSPVISTTSIIKDISDVALYLSKKMIKKVDSFALRVSRSGEHDFTSQQVAIRIGNDIVNSTSAKVDLTSPDFELFIEIRDKRSYLFDKKIQGLGGLPYGSQGDVISLIYDYKSILASWYLLRRGCNVDFILSNKNVENDLNRFLKDWFIDSKIFFMDFEKNGFYDKINNIIDKGNYLAFVTSHTLFEDEKEVLMSITEFKKNIKISVLHPLISMNNVKIDSISKEIGILQ